MISFWIIAAIMVAAALFFVVPHLLKGPAMPVDDAAADARRRLQSLETAFADGHLEKSAYETKKQALAAEVLPPVSDTGITRPRSPKTALTAAVVVPLAAMGLYLQVGDLRPLSSDAPAGSATVSATDSSPADQPGGSGNAPDLTQAIQQLSARLAQDPNDVEGWYLLGRSYMAVQQYDNATNALSKAVELDGTAPALMIDYAEALAFSSNSGTLPQQARQLLNQALSIQPDAQKALWLLGMGDFQDGNYTSAIEQWERLKALLEPGSGVAQQVSEQLALARQRTGLQEAEPAAAEPAAAEPVAAEPVAAARAASAPADGPALTVEVSLDQSLAGNVRPGDTVFIFARAAAGPPMPLAVQRLTAGQLPATVRLDSSMSMTPAMTLATFPEVVVGARIARSGSATPQPGDMEAVSPPVANNSSEPIVLNIDTVR